MNKYPNAPIKIVNSNQNTIDNVSSLDPDLDADTQSEININKKLYYDNNIKTKNTYSYFLNKHKPLNDFIKKYTRPAIEEKNEDPYWYYCIECRGRRRLNHRHIHFLSHQFLYYLNH